MNGPQVLKHLGIGCILAEDFAHAFSSATLSPSGYHPLTVKGISEIDRGVDQISVSLDSGRVIAKSTGQEFLHHLCRKKMREIINAGGIDGILKDLAKVRVSGHACRERGLNSNRP